MNVKIKICGMTNRHNVEDVLKLKPDYMGFIFYSKSPRCVKDRIKPDFIRSISSQTIATGVFVDEDHDAILRIADRYGLAAVQLHGSETPEMCYSIKSRGITVIKAFAIASGNDFDITKKYGTAADYFLFDTKTENHGGSGKTFDWSALESYKGTTPYFLSGGISPQNISAAAQTGCYAIDINSRFETEPGMKDSRLIGESLKILTLNKE